MKATRIKRLFAFLLACMLMVSACVLPVSAVGAEDDKDFPAPYGEQDTNKDDYTKGVWLHVIDGNFSGDFNGHNVANQASVWVNFADGSRKLPETLPTVTSLDGTLIGWYTESPTVKESHDNGFTQRSLVQTNGTAIVTYGEDGHRITEKDAEVPSGVQVLYAAFKYDAEPQTKLVTFYLDWNGINGMWGKCLTCTRKFGDKFTAKDAAVYGLNLEAGVVATAEIENKLNTLSGSTAWQALKEYWETHPVNGYTFKGWAIKPNATEKDVIKQDTDVTDEMTFYAVWAKSGQTNQTFERVDPEAGPATGIHLVTLEANAHAKKDASVTLAAFVTPVRADAKITWTLEYWDTDADYSLADLFRKHPTTTLTVKNDGETETTVENKFKASANGKTLTITSLDNMRRAFTVTVSVTGKDGEISGTNSATVNFTHNWNAGTETPAKVGEAGKIEYKCVDCGTTRTVTLPALPSPTAKPTATPVPPADEASGDDMTIVPSVPKTSTKSTAEPEPTLVPDPKQDGNYIDPNWEDKSENKDDYTKGVWFHALYSDFTNPDGSRNHYLSSKWVDFDGVDEVIASGKTSDKMVDVTKVPNVKSAYGGTLKGWYTTPQRVEPYEVEPATKDTPAKKKMRELPPPTKKSNPVEIVHVGDDGELTVVNKVPDNIWVLYPWFEYEGITVATPTPVPTATPAPTATPTPTAAPTATSTPTPTAEPTKVPQRKSVTQSAATSKSTAAPTATPKPTAVPTAVPTVAPKPTAVPTTAPTATPKPTAVPTTAPTVAPKPTAVPTAVPTATPKPTAVPTAAPTVAPKPTAVPTAAPTVAPKPTAVPTAVPTVAPKPTAVPTAAPTVTPKPTAVPTPVPTATPQPAATAAPTKAPEVKPTAAPTAEPTATPTPTPEVKGDVNGDGKVSSSDALQIQRFIVGRSSALNELTPEQRKALDVNGDGKLTSADALQIQRFVVGRPSVLTK